jgi:large subunit ribosomal protein L4
MAATVKAPLIDAAGQATKQVTLEPEIFAVEVKPHLVHEAVRAELNANRAGTRGAKSRGLVAGGRAKPWRQKGTGRARQGTTRAPQWRGGGVTFPPTMRSFEVKVNKKAMKAAMRSALASHVAEGTLALIPGDLFAEPSTKAAKALVEGFGKELPLVVVVQPEEETLVKSFRNLAGVAVTTSAEVEVTAIVWARTLLVSEGALELLERRAT